MRWFKHYIETSRDPFICRLIGQFGLEGYARYWRIIETITENMDPIKREPLASLPWPEWEKILLGKRKQLLSYLLAMANEGRIKVVATPELVTIVYPNILKIQGEYFRKSGQRPDKSRRNIRPRSIEDRSKKNALKEQEHSAEAAGHRPALQPAAYAGQKLRINAKQDDAFARAFPWVERPAEYAKMDSWLLSNPERHISKFGAFAHRWLSKIPQPSLVAPVYDRCSPVGTLPRETWTCANCHAEQASEKGFLRVCLKCGAPQ